MDESVIVPLRQKGIARRCSSMDRIRHARRWTRQLTLAPDAEIVLAAEGREGLVGYCGGQIGPVEGDRRIGEVHTLYLLRSVQGGGLGRRLLHALAKVLRARGAGALRLWVLDGNDQACGFYRRLGGVAAGSRPVSGWGGAFQETAYVWRDIDSLTGG